MPFFAKKNAAYTCYVALIDQGSGKLFKANPTLASGDVTVSIDGGAFANVTSLPTVAPASSKQVKVTLTSAEMNGDVIGVLFSDAAGAEWNDLYVEIRTSARLEDDLAFPTVSGRSIDVATTGEVGLDFDNVKDATAGHTLTNITVPVVTSVTNDVGITQAGADKVWGTTVRTLSAAGVQAIWDALTSALTTAGSIGKRLVDAIPNAVAGAAGGLFIAGTNAATTITGALTTTFTGNLTGSVGSVTGAVGSVTGNVGGNVTGSVGSVAAGGITAASFAAGAINSTAIATDAIGAAELAADGVAEIAGAVWDVVLASHLTAGSTGAALNGAGSAGDPWTTALPGAYGAGTAGFIVGTNLNAKVGDVPTATQNADALLNRDMSAVSDTNTRSPLNALRRLRNKNDAAVVPGKIRIYKENDSTTAYDATITTDGAALPVTVFDPDT